MLLRNNCSLCVGQAFRQMTRLELLSRAQNWKVEACHFDPYHLMSAGRSTFRVSVGECMAEAVVTRIGMPLDHGECRFRRSRPLIPRACRAPFRDDVAWLAGGSCSGCLRGALTA